MKSGLEGRNNVMYSQGFLSLNEYVSMKSGLEGRNNTPAAPPYRSNYLDVSMKSGLEGRNNATRIGAVETILIQSQ